MPEPQDVHVDSVLTNFSRKYSNEAFIWPEVMPTIKVNKRSDVFFRYSKEEYFRLPDDRISSKSYANEVGLKVDTDNYSVKDHALEDWVAKEEEENADTPLQPRTDATELILELMNLVQEKRVADIVFAAANYPTGNKVQLSGTSRWSGSADDPIGDILAGLDAAFMRPNTIIFGAEAWTVFRRLPEVLDAVKSSTRYQGSPGGIASATEVAGLFDVERVLIGRGRYTASKEGQTATYSRLWGKHCSLLYVKKNPSIKSITWGATFTEMLMTVMTGWDGRRGPKGATWLKPAWNSDEHIIASDVGYFIENAVA